MATPSPCRKAACSQGPWTAAHPRCSLPSALQALSWGTLSPTILAWGLLPSDQLLLALALPFLPTSALQRAWAIASEGRTGSPAPGPVHGPQTSGS